MEFSRQSWQPCVVRRRYGLGRERGDSDGFTINFEAPIHLPGRSSPEECRARLQPLTRRLEWWVLAHPEEWELWTRLEWYLAHESNK